MQDADERQQLLDLINENTQKLLVIINDVVNIAKIESGKQELVMSNVDLNQVLSEQAEHFRNDVKSGVTLTTQFASDLQLVTSDLARVVEVLRHLLSNAVKFTSQGEIVLGYDAPVNGRIRIWLRDTGKGIAEGDLERVFDSIYKVNEIVPGAGLGLGI